MAYSDEHDIQNLYQPGPAGTWVQTERAAHEAFAHLIAEAPRAAQLLHVLIANMDKSNALVASHATLAKLTNVSVATVKRALQVLIEQAWIQTIRLGGERGGTLAYVINCRVAWADSRDNLRFARFNARVLVSCEDQTDLGWTPLKAVPVLAPFEAPFHGSFETERPDRADNAACMSSINNDS